MHGGMATMRHVGRLRRRTMGRSTWGGAWAFKDESCWDAQKRGMSRIIEAWKIAGV
jgi:hypothetical protein